MTDGAASSSRWRGRRFLLAIYVVSTNDGAPPFWQDPDRMEGFMALSGLGALLAPWAALAALGREKDALARDQALELQLQRSELERQALDARLHLLQGQVAPHFASTRSRTSRLLSMLDHRRRRQSSEVSLPISAPPCLCYTSPWRRSSLQLVQAYLELMHMRMPDGLRFELNVDQSALALRCPPTTLLTLVDNAVCHGIDPSEEGGRIEIDVQRRGDRCLIRVSDSGVGLHAAIAQRRRGELMGNSEGEALRALSDRWMSSQNVVNPDRFSYVIAPWRASDPRG